MPRQIILHYYIEQYAITILDITRNEDLQNAYGHRLYILPETSPEHEGLCLGILTHV